MASRNAGKREPSLDNFLERTRMLESTRKSGTTIINGSTLVDSVAFPMSLEPAAPWRYALLESKPV